MNGFKGVFLCFFFISCVRVDIKEYVGDALFFVYRSAPLDNSKEVSFWNSPLDYKNEKGDTLSPVSQILLTDMGLDYLVLSIGSHFFSQEMFVESITYEKGGSLVIINMSPLIERVRKSSDLGYPIFIKNKFTKEIEILENNTRIYYTNK